VPLTITNRRRAVARDAIDTWPPLGTPNRSSSLVMSCHLGTPLQSWSACSTRLSSASAGVGLLVPTGRKHGGEPSEGFGVRSCGFSWRDLGPRIGFRDDSVWNSYSPPAERMSKRTLARRTKQKLATDQEDG
jgi:hypothetical protein